MSAGAREAGLWRQRDFRYLWAAQTISALGSHVSMLAIPLAAALALDASPAQMGVLAAMSALPSLLLGLFAGVLVDRRRRRPLLVMADIGRALVLLVVPLAWWLDLLRIELLFAAALLAGSLSLVFDIAWQAYLPGLVTRERLVEGNGKLELSRSASEVAGPGVAGTLVQLLTAPVAVLLDAVSFLASALCLAAIGHDEPPPQRDHAARPNLSPSLRHDIAEGLRTVFRDRVLRSLATATATAGLFNGAIDALFVLFLTRTLDLTPALIGAIFTAGGAGFILGAMAPERMARRVSAPLAIAAPLLLLGLSDLLVPLAGGPVWVVVPLLAFAQMSFGLGLTAFRVAEVSLRQARAPDQLLGRVNATARMATVGAAPLGALAGGVAGELIGLRTTLALAALGEIAAVLWLLPLWSFQPSAASVQPLDEG